MPVKFGALGEPRAQTEIRVRKAARALPRHDLGNAYGHVSARLDAASFLVCPPRPMSTIGPGEACTVVPVEGALPDGVLGEVRVHQQIYKRRPDVNGITRTFLPDVLTLSAMALTPKPRHGFGTYFASGVPLWPHTGLLRDDAAAADFTAMLGPHRAIVMRGNGCVVTGATVEESVVMAYYLEQAARTELAVLAASHVVKPIEYSEAECKARAVSAGMIFERMWEYLTHGDPE
jgi:HCOMODA/2-hydroxy-3-carboxy-muconic semialdehyde decarboxylase